jgi:hypothetical protein
MLDRARERARALLRRARRFERRELREFRAWLEHTRNLLHLSILVIVPLLIAFVTWLSNAVEILPFLLFPPLASGTYTLFAQPESRYASPRRFVGGLTAGGLCGWIAFEGVTRYWYAGQTSGSTVDPAAAGFGIFLTGLVTWALDVEEASAFSSALLVFVVDVSGGAYLLPVVPGVAVAVTPQFAYVLSVLVSSSIVAVIFYAWRERFYERRARYLYRSRKGDDRRPGFPGRGSSRSSRTTPIPTTSASSGRRRTARPPPGSSPHRRSSGSRTSSATWPSWTGTSGTSEGRSETGRLRDQ